MDEWLWLTETHIIQILYSKVHIHHKMFQHSLYTWRELDLDTYQVLINKMPQNIVTNL